MNLLVIFKLILGIYLLISSYYIVKKDKLILLLWGYGYILGKKVDNIKGLESDLAKSAKIFGIALIIFSIIDFNDNNPLIGILEVIFLIKYLIDSYIINKNIINEKYD